MATQQLKASEISELRSENLWLRRCYVWGND